MVDAVVAHCINTYGPSYVSAILFFPQNPSSSPVISAVQAIVQDFVVVPPGMLSITSFLAYYPHVFLNKAGKTEEGRICLELRTAIENSGQVEVICDHWFSAMKRSVLQSPQPDSQPAPGMVPGMVPVAPPTVNPSPYRPPANNTQLIENVTMMHIILWTVVFLILGFLLSCYHLAILDGSGEPEFKSKSFEVQGARQTQKVQ